MDSGVDVISDEEQHQQPVHHHLSTPVFSDVIPAVYLEIILHFTATELGQYKSHFQQEVSRQEY